MDSSSFALAKEEVRNQLDTLGFRNVPEEVLEEFVIDLLKLKNVKPTYSARHEVYTSTSEEEPESDSYISEKENIKQNNLRRKHSTLKPQKQITVTSTEIPDEEDDEREEDTRSISSRPSSSTSTRSFSSTTSTYRSGIGVIKPATLTRKKTDPVARYHNLRDEWSQDKFLQSQSKPRQIKVVYPDYEPWKPPHKDLNAMRPTYVVPTEKRRDKLRFEIRQKLMSNIN